MPGSGQVVMNALSALEARDLERLHALYHPDVCFHWPPGLPYAGTHCGREVMAMTQLFSEIWSPLQPDAETRRLDPRILAVDGDEVIAEYTWRGRGANGSTFSTRTLARYEVRDGRLVDARMFHFDLLGLVSFIEDARS